MKIRLLAAVGFSLPFFLLFLPSSVLAGEYHYGSTLICSDCHTMHYSQQHAFDSSNPAPNPPEEGGPFNYLLRAKESDLCLLCHDGRTFAPDVKGANTGNDVREAGAIPTGQAPYENWKGHTLGVLAIPPGGSGQQKLQCISCHAQHGSPSYRNLTSTVTYAKGTNDTTKDVFLRSWTLGAIATNYSVSNVDFNEPNPDGSAIGEFCAGCHNKFHGGQGDSNMGGAGGTAWLRHPDAGANIGAIKDGQHSSLALFSSRLNRVKVMSPSGDWGTQGQIWMNPPPDLTPTCITCHKAHGNKNPFGLIYMQGTGIITEEGDGGTQVTDLCHQCHTQGN